MVIWFLKRNRQQLGSIFADVVTGKRFIVKQIVHDTVKGKCAELT